MYRWLSSRSLGDVCSNGWCRVWDIDMIGACGWLEVYHVRLYVICTVCLNVCTCIGGHHLRILIYVRVKNGRLLMPIKMSWDWVFAERTRFDVNHNKSTMNLCFIPMPGTVRVRFEYNIINWSHLWNSHESFLIDCHHDIRQRLLSRQLRSRFDCE